jgi:transmembrane sensor
MNNLAEGAFASAKDIKVQAASWIERRDRADWGEQDQAVLNAWLEQSAAHFLAYHRMANAWSRADRLVALRGPASLPQPLKKNVKDRNFVVRTAAVVLGLAVLGAGTLLLMRPQDRTFATPVGGHRIVALADGSSVELNTDTVMRTNLSATHRVAVLEKGEAYFQIAHDTAHPFRIAVGSRQIIVLGTKFSVRKDQDTIRVTLFDGRVRVASMNIDQGLEHSQSAVLGAGDVLVATTKTLSVTHRATAELERSLDWRHGLLMFDHTPLSDVANEYNRYNRQKIIIADTATARLKMSGTMPTDNIAEFTSIARKVFGLQVRSNEDQVVISR